MYLILKRVEDYMKNYQQLLANGIANGIDAYFSKKSFSFELNLLFTFIFGRLSKEKNLTFEFSQDK